MVYEAPRFGACVAERVGNFTLDRDFPKRLPSWINPRRRSAIRGADQAVSYKAFDPTFGEAEEKDGRLSIVAATPTAFLTFDRSSVAKRAAQHGDIRRGNLLIIPAGEFPGSQQQAVDECLDEAGVVPLAPPEVEESPDAPPPDEGSQVTTPDGYACSATEAALPDHKRRKVPRGSAPAVPRRPCTLPSEGCVSRGSEGSETRLRPPLPGVRVASATEQKIVLTYDIGRDLETCRPVQLSVSLTDSRRNPAAPFFTEEFPVSAPSGELVLDYRRELPPFLADAVPDMVNVSSFTQEGAISEAARIRPP